MACIGGHLETSARLDPDRIALKCAAREYSWGGFLAAVQSVENTLRAKTPAGARVALLLSHPADILIAFFACARAGRIATVLDAAWPHPRIGDVLAATEPAVCIDDLRVARMLAEPSASGLQYAGHKPFPDETTDFYAGFTSGSTGLPKGYVRSHRSWLESFRLSAPDFDSAGPGHIVIPGGLSHSLHLYGAVHGLHRGTSVTVLPRFDPRTVLNLVAADGVGAALYATPTQLQLIADAARHHGPAPTPLLVFSSGAKWPDGARDSFAKVFPFARLVEFYGASETSFISFARPEDQVPPGSVGRPAEGVFIAVGDPNHPLPAGVSGPLWVKSPLLFSGYICGDASGTAWRGGWLSIGDHGLLDAAGYLYLTGRENRMVITSGMNVYPEEIEAALISHPAVRLAAVLGVRDALRGARLEAFVELGGVLDDPPRALARFCRNILGPGKCPKRFHIYDKLPLTAGGKPDLQALGRGLEMDPDPGRSAHQLAERVT